MQIFVISVLMFVVYSQPIPKKHFPSFLQKESTQIGSTYETNSNVNKIVRQFSFSLFLTQ